MDFWTQSNLLAAIVVLGGPSANDTVDELVAARARAILRRLGR